MSIRYSGPQRKSRMNFLIQTGNLPASVKYLEMSPQINSSIHLSYIHGNIQLPFVIDID